MRPVLNKQQANFLRKFLPHTAILTGYEVIPKGKDEANYNNQTLWIRIFYRQDGLEKVAKVSAKKVAMWKI